MAKSRHSIEGQVHQLRAAIEQLVLSSRKYAALRRLLRGGGYELQMYLVPLDARQASGDDELELTAADRRFLKKAGIRF